MGTGEFGENSPIGDGNCCKDKQWYDESYHLDSIIFGLCGNQKDFNKNPEIMWLFV